MRSRLSEQPARPPRTAAVQGIACSLLLHGLFAALVVLLLLRPQEREIPLARFLPVDLVASAPPATAPPAARSVSAGVPRARPARSVPASPRQPVALVPQHKPPPPDALENRLKQLAQLRQPDSMIPHAKNGASDEAGEDGTAGAAASYGVRDFLRAQIERRWSLDLAHARDVTVRIHVVVAGDGTVTKAEIVDRARYANDAVWRAVALSARNAVLLSSPLRLPAGAGAPLDVTLALNPDDAVR